MCGGKKRGVQMKVRFLGSSAGVATLTHANSSALISAAEDALLIDCGEPVSATLIRNKIPLDSFSGLVLTHLHPDHTGGFTQLIQTLQILRRERPLTVFMPAEGIEVFNRLLDTVYLYRSILPFKLDIVPIETGKTFECGEFKLEFYGNEHLACFRSIAEKAGCPAPCESFSVALEAGGKRLVMSGDIKRPEELIAPLRVKSDALVTELVHYPVATFVEQTCGFLPDKVVFTHYLTNPADEPLARDNPALAEINHNVVFAEDLMEVEV